MEHQSSINKMKAFSFVDRDYENKEVSRIKLEEKYKGHFQQVFKAKLIPTTVTTPLLEDMIATQKKQREINKYKRKEWWKKVSILPDRMTRA